MPLWLKDSIATVEAIVCQALASIRLPIGWCRAPSRTTPTLGVRNDALYAHGRGL